MSNPTAEKESAWFLVRDDPTVVVGNRLQYLSAKNGFWEWSSMHIDAFRMCRKQDAEALYKITEEGRVEEHQWPT